MNANSGAKPYIFLSYSHLKQDKAEHFVSYLRSKGVDVWYAAQIPPGAIWSETIVKAIKSCSAVVLIYSSEADESLDVLNELTCV